MTDETCDGGATCKRTQVTYGYDAYGNVTSEDLIADLDDTNHTYDRQVVRTFTQQAGNWLVGLPLSETVSTKTIPATQVKKTEFFYDATSCADTSLSPTPTKGKLTAIKYWLKNDVNSDDISPVVRMGYDQYGNLVCRKAPRANTSSTDNTTYYTYDTNYKMFLSSVSYPITGFPSSSTKYYGVDPPGGGDTFSPSGLFGQVYKVTDPNGQSTTYTYDPFGRKKTETLADHFWTQWQYNDTGGVGIQNSNQNVYTWNSAGIWSRNYYDGKKRYFYSTKSGPDNKTIAARTVYDQRGKVSRKTVPFFEADGEGRSWTYAYDPVGRPVTVTNPDATTRQACYSNWITATIDENKHRKRQVGNAFGMLIEVDEYTGTFDTCSTNLGTLYVTTLYGYDVIGNLTTVANAKQQTTSMVYDTLSRKTSMSDPDMGSWNYTYWPNGLLKTQQDAKQNTITFDYDNLNRQTRKTYPDATYVELRYDETGAANRWGRLTTMVNPDRTVSTGYSYDPVGRIATTTKTADNVPYPINYVYTNGRLDTVTYPNNEQVSYSYNAESLDKIQNGAKNYGYANYSGYNSLLQPHGIAYGNGITTTFEYIPENNRLLSIFTNGPNLQGQSLSFGYEYFYNGNIKSIASSLNPPPPSFNGATYAINPTKAHRLDSITGDTVMTVSYDNNGNMTSIGQLQMIFDYDNMLQSANNNAVRFTYDGAGKRVKKQGAGYTKVYIDDLYECTNGNDCAIYIFAGSKRIALKRGTEIFYYHKDHLGSTAMITDGTGNKVESLSFYPFGETRSDEGTSFSHKYTAQEQDAETGLYNYNARYYFPDIGRFVSPDTIVPNPGNPQSLNRYAYVQNNPMNFVDPTGHEGDSADSGNVTINLGIDAGSDSTGGNIATISFDASSAWSSFTSFVGSIFSGAGDASSTSTQTQGIGSQGGVSASHADNGASSYIDTTPALPQNSWANSNRQGISTSFSSSSLQNGTAISGGLEYPTKTYGSLTSGSLDVQIGYVSKPWQTVEETTFGPLAPVGKFVSVGLYNIRGTNNRGGLAIHFGLGFSWFVNHTITYPTVNALPPSFPNDFDLGWYQN